MGKPIGVLQDQASGLIDEVWKSGKVRAWVEVGEWLELMAQDKSNPEIAGLGKLIKLFEEEFLG